MAYSAPDTAFALLLFLKVDFGKKDMSAQDSLLFMKFLLVLREIE